MNIECQIPEHGHEKIPNTAKWTKKKRNEIEIAFTQRKMRKERTKARREMGYLTIECEKKNKRMGEIVTA